MRIATIFGRVTSFSTRISRSSICAICRPYHQSITCLSNHTPVSIRNRGDLSVCGGFCLFGRPKCLFRRFSALLHIGTVSLSKLLRGLDLEVFFVFCKVLEEGVIFV